MCVYVLNQLLPVWPACGAVSLARTSHTLALLGALCLVICCQSCEMRALLEPQPWPRTRAQLLTMLPRLSGLAVFFAAKLWCSWLILQLPVVWRLSKESMVSMCQWSMVNDVEFININLLFYPVTPFRDGVVEDVRLYGGYCSILF